MAKCSRGRSSNPRRTRRPTLGALPCTVGPKAALAPAAFMNVCVRSYAPEEYPAAVERASVWFIAYPLSFITRPGRSFLAAPGDLAMWQAFRETGIRGIHTGPVKLAGGITGWSHTPRVRRGRAPCRGRSPVGAKEVPSFKKFGETPTFP